MMQHALTTLIIFGYSYINFEGFPSLSIDFVLFGSSRYALQQQSTPTTSGRLRYCSC
ncbi:hypothetical protein RO3G_06705 [Rhizopus delemar RA 99-880]|uniref:Uncharacterized protein n=1 Tax=Rhizopus delemar (strain RA 99-880 / ATCC MYA-4621 / FGSC 9543 / NRRL 43880) TaxID=246409 RepID=I1C0M0_RHIO9|nr:hypothetical protein RO3G_06705 [Rhizopus delemar RA 99-880]|eukprot:EIE82000.1 hypothetical protein RO3G_06705 [Rhizopus delemar RA 99-880]